MVTIPVQLSNELAQRVLPLQHRLPEIIELGLHELAAVGETESAASGTNEQVLDALLSTGIVTLPRRVAGRKPRLRRTPILAGGPPASEMIIAERRREL